VNVNSILFLLRNLDLNVQEYISAELGKLINKNRKRLVEKESAHVPSDEERRVEILNSACGIWDWDESVKLKSKE